MGQTVGDGAAEGCRCGVVLVQVDRVVVAAHLRRRLRRRGRGQGRGRGAAGAAHVSEGLDGSGVEESLELELRPLPELDRVD